MLELLRKHVDEDEQGFTLIELLVVVIIIGILAAIAIPTFLNQRQRGWDAAAQSDLRNMAIAMETCAVNNDPPGTFTGCDGTEDGFNESAGVEVDVDVADDGLSWSATATHDNSDNTYTYDSTTGVITADGGGGG